jgi:hypothetical protein
VKYCSNVELLLLRFIDKPVQHTDQRSPKDTQILKPVDTSDKHELSKHPCEPTNQQVQRDYSIPFEILSVNKALRITKKESPSFILSFEFLL